MALSVVGAERLPDSGYLRAKMAQEKLIEDSPIPYSIVHATQFFEFVGRIADEATSGNTVRLAHVLIQPMAAEDVASALADVTVGPPANGIIETGGPQQFHLDELIRNTLRERHDPRKVITDPHAPYYGAELHERTLVPASGARLAKTRFDDWLHQSTIGNSKAAHRGHHSGHRFPQPQERKHSCHSVAPRGASACPRSWRSFWPPPCSRSRLAAPPGRGLGRRRGGRWWAPGQAGDRA